MLSAAHFLRWLSILLLCWAVSGAWAQSFRVQCPNSTTLHPNDTTNTARDVYAGPRAPTTLTASNGRAVTYVSNGGRIKCQQISGGDGFATMADGTQMYLFGFGPLSGLKHIADGLPGTELAAVFNQSNLTTSGTINPG